MLGGANSREDTARPPPTVSACHLYFLIKLREISAENILFIATAQDECFKMFYNY